MLSLRTLAGRRAPLLLSAAGGHAKSAQRFVELHPGHEQAVFYQAHHEDATAREIISRRVGHEPRECKTAEEAVEPYVNSNGTIFIQAGAATPHALIDGMVNVAKSKQVTNLRTYHMHLEGRGPQPLDDPEATERITPIPVFIGANLRKQVANGTALYLPIYLCDLPQLFRKGIVRPDASFLNCSPPNKHGYCTLGTSVDWSLSGAQHSKAIVGVINKKMPRIYGDGLIHYSQFDAVLHEDRDLEPQPVRPITQEFKAIGKHIAELVPDGATLQLGIGAVPDAVLSQLRGHRDLGIHTEMFSDGVLPLVEKGVINNSKKSMHRGTIISSFVVGSRALYDFCDDNMCVKLMDVAYTNAVDVIAAQNKMIAVNSAIEMDLTGQAAGGSIGLKIYSGFGGQVDFMTGAQQCPEGKGILAFQSRTKRGESRIVPELKHAAGVVTTRAITQYVVTEYGVAQCFGKPMSERARLLISIAHPEDRPYLERSAKARFGRSFML